MLRWADRLGELDTVSPSIARKLIDTLLVRQTTSLLTGAAAFVVLGLISFIGTGSPWYLAALAIALCICFWRLYQARSYARAPDSAPPVAWARRFLCAGWVAAASWGAWGTVVLFEPDRTLVVVVIGVLSANMVGAAVRNSAIRAIANGQVFLALTPLLVCCAISDDIYLNAFAAFVAVHIYTALTLTRFLHRQTLQLLTHDEEKSNLVARLEIANQELEVINEHLETLVVTDALTGTANRRAFDLAFAREWRRSAREQTPLSLLILDIDNFKAFNDRYGHQAGDKCLRQVAAAIGSALRRPGDMLARYGGEEFAVILPNTNLYDAVRVAHNIVAMVAERKLVHEESPFGFVTVSAGAACIVPDLDANIERLTGLADAALYAAKRGGRNRVHAAEDGGVERQGVAREPVASLAC
jgi:diguanylate cyclase (GGDEF)-like protein